MMLEQLDEVLALHRQDLGQRRAPALRRRRPGSSRARRRCGRPRRTCARCGRGRCPRRRTCAPCAASAGVSALARTFRRRTSSAQAISSAKSPESSGWTVGTSPSMTSPVPPSMVMKLAVLHHHAAHRQRAGAVLVDAHVAGAGDAGLAHAARHHGGVAGHAAARGQDALGRVHAVDVLGAGLAAHQDHLLALGARRFSASSAVNTTLPDGRARRGRQAAWRSPCAAPWDRASDAAAGRATPASMRATACLLVDQALAHHVDGDLERRLARCACRCASAACRACRAGP